MISVYAIEYYDTGDDTVKTLLVGTRGFTTPPTADTDGDEVQQRVTDAMRMRRDIFDIGTTGGASRVGYGALVLANADGALDAFRGEWVVDGWSLTHRIADSMQAVYPDDYETILSGTMEQPEVQLDHVTLHLRDRKVYLDAPFQTDEYGGTNVLPSGVDGLESDLKGKPKPWCGGAPFNCTPVQVNTALLIHQFSADGMRDLAALYDSGALKERDPADNYADQADLEAREPVDGTYLVWPEGGMVRVSSPPFGQLTGDVIDGLSPADRSAAALYRRVLLRAGEDDANIVSDDLAALDAANRATLGLYVSEATTVQAVLDDIARSVGAWWGPDALGQMRIARLEAPSGTPDLVLTVHNIVQNTLQQVPLNDGGLPAYRVTARGCPNYTVQSSGLAGNVGSARRARLAQPYQDGIATNEAVQLTHKRARDLIVETKLACRTAVQVEAERLLALYEVNRARFEVVAFGTAAFLRSVDLGKVVSLTYPRFGLDAGVLLRIIGYQLDPDAGTASLTLWG